MKPFKFNSKHKKAFNIDNLESDNLQKMYSIIYKVHFRPEAEIKEFEPRPKFETRLKYRWFQLKLYLRRGSNSLNLFKLQFPRQYFAQIPRSENSSLNPNP